MKTIYKYYEKQVGEKLGCSDSYLADISSHAFDPRDKTLIVEEWWMAKMKTPYPVAWELFKPLFLVSATSTEVERMNSIATHTYSPKRRSVKETNFENTILMSYNMNAARREVELAYKLDRLRSAETQAP